MSKVINDSANLYGGLAELAAKLAQAKEHYQEAEQEAQAKSREVTRCLNLLNEAQKAFDAKVVEIRKDAPRNSDWHSKSLPRGNVRADYEIGSEKG